MRHSSDIHDADIERLLGGQELEDDRLQETGQFFRELDAAHPEEPTAAFEAAHVAAMLDAARDVAGNGSAALPGADVRRVPSPRTAWAAAYGRLAAHKWVSAAALCLMGVLAFGGAAHAGVLPAPIQRATADFARQVGITVPASLGVKQASPVDLHELASAKAHEDGGASGNSQNHSGVAANQSNGAKTTVASGTKSSRGLAGTAPHGSSEASSGGGGQAGSGGTGAGSGAAAGKARAVGKRGTTTSKKAAKRAKSKHRASSAKKTKKHHRGKRKSRSKGTQSAKGHKKHRTLQAGHGADRSADGSAETAST